MRNLLKKERIVETDYDRYQLSYQLHQMKEEMDLYGVSISQFNQNNKRKMLFDQADIFAFSESLQDTEAFFEILYQETVFPVHLHSIADDWYEQHYN